MMTKATTANVIYGQFPFMSRDHQKRNKITNSESIFFT